MNVDLEQLVASLSRVAAKQENGEDVSLRDELHGIPVPVRAFLASIILAAADRPLTGANLATVGAFSRGSTLRDYGGLVAQLRESAPAFVAECLADASRGQSVEELTRELRQRDATIAELRAEVNQQKGDVQVALSYARDLHELYREELEDVERERAEKVRPLRPVE